MRVLSVLVAVVLSGASPAWADKRLDDAVKKAEALVAKGKQDDAVKVLENFASRARDAEAPFALAALLTKLGRLDEAGAALAKAGERLAAAPPAVRVRVLVARSAFALRAGTLREASDFARQAFEAQAGADSLAALAHVQSRAGDPGARATAAKAVQAGPGSAAAQIASGDALMAARLATEAEGAYRRASQLEPGSAAALAGLARALAAQGKATNALEAAHAATKADAHFAEALAALGLATLAADPHDRSGEAVAAVQQAAFLEPKNPLVKLEVGRVFEGREQLEQAAAAYEKAALLDPTWAAPRIASLALRLRAGDADATLAGLRALSDEMQASGDAELLLGQALLRKGDAAGAKAPLERAAAALPGLAEAHAARGEAAHELGDAKLAADAYGRAVERDPANIEYLSRYGLFLARDGRPDEAVRALLEVASQPEGRTPRVLMNLGSVYRSFKPPRVDDAVTAYERALKLDPKNGEAALGVAESYRAGKQWARAISAYEHVQEVDRRREGDSLLGVAWCYCLSHDLDRARFYAGLAARKGANMRKLRAALSSSCAASRDE